MDAQCRLGDDAERAFGSDEQLREIGTDRGPRRTSRAHDAAVGQYHFEADDHVLDLAVARRVLAGAPARQPTTNRRQRDRLRPVAEGVAATVKLFFEVVAERAGANREQQRLVVGGDDAGEAGDVEHHAAEHRNARATHAAAPTGRSDRHARSVAIGEHARHLVDRHRAGDGRGHAAHRRRQRPLHGERPPIAARLGPHRVARVDLDAGRPPRGHQLVAARARSADAVADVSGGEFDGRCRLAHQANGVASSAAPLRRSCSSRSR
jgi:hypothetical protein